MMNRTFCALVVAASLFAGANPPTLEAQKAYPTACPPSVVFYSEFNPPYYEKGGYSFNANPFNKASNAPAGATSANFYSSKGSPVDRTGRVRWYGAGLFVTCWLVEMIWPIPDLKVAQNEWELGYLENIGGSGDCVDDDALEFVDYDPYDPYDDSPDCGSGGTGGTSEGSGEDLDCHSEWVVLEISYDGGMTWHTLWEGYATVCE